MKTILVADDDSHVLGLVKYLLESCGHHVITAADGLEAWAKIEVCQPDLAILDIVMPDMDGVTLCRRIKCTPGLRDVKVLMFTIKAYPTERTEASHAGADGFVSKPFDAEKLLRDIDLIFNQGLPEPEPAGFLNQLPIFG